jgi:hypothetical protein
VVELGALADALNAQAGSPVWHGGYFASGADAVATAEYGPMGAVLQAPGGPAYMVAVEPVGSGEFLVRDPIPGVTYRVDTSWIERYVSGGVFR